MSLVDRLRGVVRPGGGPPKDGPYDDGLPEGGPCDRPDDDTQSSVGAGFSRRAMGRLSPDLAADVLEGEWRESCGHRFLVVDRSYAPGHRHGNVAVADGLPPPDGLWPTLSLLAGTSCAGKAVFVDLETTGVAGGAGTYAFLVGCGWFDGGRFRTRQLFLSSFAAERALLEAVGEIAGEAGTVVTYNGKTFDLPLIETRFVLHRMHTPFAGLPHVDMLHPARRLWRSDDADAGGGQPGCRLSTLEQSLCGYEREGDVDGFEIPGRYFQYVRSGDPRPLGPVFEHNRRDLLSLALLTARAAQLLDDGPAASRTAREALGLGHLYERGGMVHEARACFARAAGLIGSPDDAPAERVHHGASAHHLPERLDGVPCVRAEALRAYAQLSRRLRLFEDAAEGWRLLVAGRECPPHVAREAMEALAVHHEHRLRDPRAARTFALKSLALQGTVRRREALQHRLSRLDRKLAIPPPAAAPLF
jgi:uncharacterized protein